MYKTSSNKNKNNKFNIQICVSVLREIGFSREKDTHFAECQSF